MICRSWRRRLIGLAFQLIAIADLRVTPCARRGGEAGLESPGKRLGGRKADRKSHLQDRKARLRDQTLGGNLEPSPPHILAEGLSEPRGEQSVEVKRREIRHPGKRVELELLVEPTVDVFEHAMHAS